MTRFALTRVLVVDDDETQLELMVIYLQKLGVVQYATAGSVDEAMDMLLSSENTFHVVFTDKDMSPSDGFDLVLNVRKHVALEHLKMAMISGRLSHETMPPAEEVQLRDFLKRHGVLPISKNGLDASVLARAIQELTGV